MSARLKLVVSLVVFPMLASGCLDVVDDGEEEERLCGSPGMVLDVWDLPSTGIRCTRVLGSLFVRAAKNSAVEARRLARLETVDANLTVEWAESLEALAPLRKVGDLILTSSSVANLAPLGNVSVMSGGILVQFMNSLETLQGLEGVERLSRLSINSNAKLKTLQGLDNLRLVEGDVLLGGNPSLPRPVIDAFLERIEVRGTVTLY